MVARRQGRLRWAKRLKSDTIRASLLPFATLQLVLLLYRTPSLGEKLPIAPPGPFHGQLQSISANAVSWPRNLQSECYAATPQSWENIDLCAGSMECQRDSGAWVEFERVQQRGGAADFPIQIPCKGLWKGRGSQVLGQVDVLETS